MGKEKINRVTGKKNNGTWLNLGGGGQQARPSCVASESLLLHHFRRDHFKEFKSCLSWCSKNEKKSSNTRANPHNLKLHLN